MRPLRAERETAPHDPSPSLWAYRLHRWWLTPAYRTVLRIGGPAVVATLALAWFVSDEGRVQAISDSIQDMRRTFEERPEFMVEALAIDGASAELSEAVRETLPVHLPASSFDLDLEELRDQAEKLDAVARAHLRVKPGGILSVVIEERQPAVLWRAPEGLVLLDATGHRVADASRRADFPDLPVIAGEGAAQAVPEALNLLAAAAPIADRLRGFERIGARRWDIVLDRRQRVLLPAEGAVTALERLIALHEARDMLERDLALVDLRNPYRPTLRLNGTAMGELHRIRQLSANGASE